MEMKFRRALRPPCATLRSLRPRSSIHHYGTPRFPQTCRSGILPRVPHNPEGLSCPLFLPGRLIHHHHPPAVKTNSHHPHPHRGLLAVSLQGFGAEPSWRCGSTRFLCGERGVRGWSNEMRVRWRIVCSGFCRTTSPRHLRLARPS